METSKIEAQGRWVGNNFRRINFILIPTKIHKLF